MTNRLNAHQLSRVLADIDTQLDLVNATLDGFASTWTADVPDAVGAAWNLLHDAHQALTEHRAQVALNPRPIPAGEAGTWALVHQNID